MDFSFRTWKHLFREVWAERERRKPRRRAGLFLEALEHRCLPSTFVVNSNGGAGGTGSTVTLWGAIAASENHAQVNGVGPTGTGNDIITFDPTVFTNAANSTITPSAVFAPFSNSTFLIPNGETLTIEGLATTNGFGIILNGVTQVERRAFYVESGGSLTLQYLTLNGFQDSSGGLGAAQGTSAPGATGGGGDGGGPAGMGGAIFNAGTLNIQNCALTNNLVSGGAGPSGAAAPGTGIGGGGGAFLDILGANAPGGVGGAGADGAGGAGTFGSGGGGGGGANGAGGAGGFGGGGGGSVGAVAGAGGFGGDRGWGGGGGGGAGMGGAIFNDGGNVTLVNDTLTGNLAVGGQDVPRPGFGYGPGGQGLGGAIFDLNGTMTIQNCTIDGNTAENGAGAIAVYGGAVDGASGTSSTITITNSVLADSTGGTPGSFSIVPNGTSITDYLQFGSVASSGSHNIIPSTTWAPLGPGALPTGSSNGNVSGRITGIAVDPGDASGNTIYITAASGGVWKTTDGGTTWAPLTDNVGSSVIFMGAIALIHPTGHNAIIYAGTGEANNSSDSFYGDGILKSIDGGATWSVVGGTPFTGKSIARIAIDTTDTTGNTLYVAVSDATNGTFGNDGIWKTTNGGTTWTNTTSAISTSTSWSDVGMDPNNHNHLVAAAGQSGGDASNGIYESYDGGATWTASGNFSTLLSSHVGRIILTFSNTSGTIYASVANSSTGALLALIESTNSNVNAATTSWSNVTNNLPNYLGGQGWYDNFVAVDPANSAHVIVGGLTAGSAVYQTTDGGSTWSAVAHSDIPHTDEHAAAFDNGNLLMGGDGGLYEFDGTTWNNLNGNLNTIQFYGIALNPTDRAIAYGGSQDNGVEKLSGGTWNQTDGGDGGHVLVDFSNPSNVYHAFPQASFSGIIQKSTDGGNTWTTVFTDTTESANFVFPFVMDPANSSRVAFGMTNLYLTTNAPGATANSSWITITQATIGTTANIDSMAFAQSDSNTMYVSSGGQIFVTHNLNLGASSTWTQVNNGPLAGFTSTIQDLEVDPSDSNIVYAVSNTFNSTGDVFKTTDGGTTWSNLSGNLIVGGTAGPVWTLQIDDTGNRLFIGTDTGVMVSTTAGGTWSQFGSMPNVQVDQLVYSVGLGILAAGTHGRGLWEYNLNSTLPSFSATITASPNLAALAFNGGPTETMLPNVGSPALAAGTSTGAPSIDQRGYFRSSTAGLIDIGAVEITEPPIYAVSPSGSSVTAGSNTTISWSDYNFSGNVDILLSTDGGTTYSTTIASNIANIGSFSWNVPSTVTTTARIKVQVAGGGNPAVSASNFTITYGPITAVTPTSGSVTIGGSTPITWTNPSGFSGNVDILLSTDGGVTYSTTIASNVANAGSYSWTVPNLPTSMARVEVQADAAGATAPASGTSSGNFTVAYGPITAVTPTSGSVTIGGSTPITWTNPSNFSGNVDILLSTDGGNTYSTTIASNIANTSSYSWTVNNLPTTQARIEVQAHAGGATAPASGTSSANFAIGYAPITAIAPHGGSVTIGGSTPITWTNPSGFSGNVDILLSTDGGTTYSTTIVSGLTNVGTYSWTVNNLPTTQARIEVRASVSGATAPTSATSSGNFALAYGPITSVSLSSTITIGASTPITWTNPSGFTGAVDILLSTDGGATYATTLARGLTNTGTYNWTVNIPPTNHARIEVMAHTSGATAPASAASQVATVVFQDTFSGSALSNFWSTKIGSFTVNSNHATASSPGTNIAVLSGVAQGDVSQTVTVTVPTSGMLAALVARYQGPGNTGMYQGLIGNTSGNYTAEIWRNLNNTWTQLGASVSLPGFSGTGTLRFDAVGNSLRLYVNGTLQAVATDSNFASGYVGLRGLQGVQFSSYSATAATTAALPFTDNFASDPAGPLSSNWFTQSGLMMVASGNATGQSSAVKNVAVLNSDPATDVSVSATVTALPNGGFAGLVARYQGVGDTNMYQAGLRNTAGTFTAEIYVNQNGTWTALANVNIGGNPGSTFTMRFDVVGTSLKLFVNNIQSATATDATLASGVTGIRLFQNVSVSSFGATAIPNSAVQATSLPFSDSLTTAGSLAPTWGVKAGAYTITGGHAVAQNTGANTIVLNSVAASDTTESVTVTNLLSGQIAALVARYQGAGDTGLYQAGLRNTSGTYTAEIWKNVAGTWTNLANVNIGGNPGSSFTLRFDAVGSSLRLSVNGILQAVTSDATFAVGSVGLRGLQNVQFSTYSAADVSPVTLPYNESFLSEPKGPLSSNWFTQSGSLTVSGGTAVGLSSAVKNVGVLNSDPTSDVSVTATVTTLPSAGFAGLVARYQGVGDTNMYQAGLRNTAGTFTAEIYVNQNGTWTALANVNIGGNPGSTFTMRFDVVGTSLKLFVNNIQSATATDATFASGVTGIRLFQNVSLSNFGTTAL